MISAALLVILALSFTGRVQAQTLQTQDVCLARWEWIAPDGLNHPDGAWTIPFASLKTGFIDFRSIAQQSQRGGLGGWGMFGYTEPMGFTGMFCLGNNPNRQFTREEVNTLSLVIGLSLDAEGPGTMGKVISSYVLNHADITGASRWKPVRMGPKGLTVKVGDVVMLQSPFDLNHKAWANYIAGRWQDYRRNKAEGLPLVVFQKWNANDMRKYFGRMSNDLLSTFVPPEYQGDGWVKPATPQSDDFETDTSASWTADNGTFTIDSGNSGYLEPTAVTMIARYNTLMDDADHCSEITLDARGGGSNGPIARKANSSTNTQYYMQKQGTFPNDVQSIRVVNGTPNVIDTYADTFTTGDQYEVCVNGTVVTFNKNGAFVGDEDDFVTPITGNLAVGLRSSSITADFEDWNAAEIAGGAVAQVIVID